MFGGNKKSYTLKLVCMAFCYNQALNGKVTCFFCLFDIFLKFLFL